MLIATACLPNTDTSHQKTHVGTPPFVGAVRTPDPEEMPDSASSLPVIAVPIKSPESTATGTEPDPIQKMSPAEQRRHHWLTQEFRCRAISTVRLRPCRFEARENGVSIQFNNGDVVCRDVSFDDNGDPQQLLDCRSSWLRIPSNPMLRRHRTETAWSGSHSGWSWKSDGETYCCPGLWIEGPKRLESDQGDEDASGDR